MAKGKKKSSGNKMPMSNKQMQDQMKGKGSSNMPRKSKGKKGR